MADTKRCKDCIYRISLGFSIYCDYLDKAGHMRPCLPGKDCTVRRTGKKQRPDIWVSKQRRWSTAKAEALRAEGKTYPAIAAELGTTKAAVQSYFAKRRKPVQDKKTPPF